MTLRKRIRKIAIVSLMACFTTTVSAQDLLAHQAPVDRRSSSVDTVMMQTIRNRENVEFPSSDLYADWDNRYAHKVTELPDVYKIDLRGFHMPTPSRVITSNFGRRWGRQHKGLDIKVYIGDTIYAAFTGKVRIVRYEANGYGNYIVIRHNNGLETIYGHLSKQLVRENQFVRAGQPIALGGNTGRSTGSHLHFETRLCGVALNPAIFFDFPHQDITTDVYTFRKSNKDVEDERATALRGKDTSPGYSKENIQGRRNYNSNNSSLNYEPREPRAENNGNGERTVYHKVAEGETLESISRECNIPLEKLCRLNGVGKYTTLRRGQLIKIS